MEIHAPTKPILTLKEAAVHLAIVTVGILIALSLEGMVEWLHHRALVREARDVIQHEIDDNARDLDKSMSRISSQVKDLGDAIRVMSSDENGKRSAVLGGALSYRTASLHNAARTTADLTGAFSYMDYAEVGRYAAVYDAQARFESMQAKALDLGVAALSSMIGRDLPSLGAAEAHDLADKLRAASASLIVASELGVDLRIEYGKMLAHTVAAEPLHLPRAAEAELAGKWKGPLGSSTVTLAFERSGREGLVGYFEVADRGTARLPLGEISFVDGKLTIRVPSLAAELGATVDGGQMTGRWNQVGMGVPITLTRE